MCDVLGQREVGFAQVAPDDAAAGSLDLRYVRPHLEGVFGVDHPDPIGVQGH